MTRAGVEAMLSEARWELIPEHMREGVRRYVLDGDLPGGFLAAVLTNNLFEAVFRADDENLEAILGWVRFVYNDLPAQCLGSAKKVAEWRQQRHDELRQWTRR